MRGNRTWDQTEPTPLCHAWLPATMEFLQAVVRSSINGPGVFPILSVTKYQVSTGAGVGCFGGNVSNVVMVVYTIMVVT